MLSLVAPWWMLGLALLPVIRWLHRGGRHRRALGVSHLGLWRGSADNPPAVGARRPPDPAWRRRALLTALFFIALAEPQWLQRHPAITLWVDDSLSMLTRETQGTRLAEGLAQFRSLLGEVEHADVEVRTLADPWRNLGAPTEATPATIVAGVGRRVPGVPPAPLLRRDSLHWLLTDGVNAALAEWPGGTRPDRVIQVAGVTRNVGLERLSARRSPDDANRIDLLLKVTNGGNAVESRELAFFSDAGKVTQSTLHLDAGATAFVDVSIAASARVVRATLTPGDALPEDDVIALDLAPLRRRSVATDPKCPGALVAAVQAHPALTMVPHDTANVDAVLDCGSHDATGHVAMLRVAAQHVPRRLPGWVQWSSSVAPSRRVTLDAQPLQVEAQLQARPADAVLVAVGDAPVVISRAGTPKLLETSLDFDSLGATRGAELPLMVNMMFEHLLGARLLDEIVVTDRGAAASRVAPSARVSSTAVARVPTVSHPRFDAVRPLLVLALLVLLWELIALGRQWVRLSATAGVPLA